MFFIPYFMMLFICGIPLFMAELALGQYSGQVVYLSFYPKLENLLRGFILLAQIAKLRN